MTDDYVPEEPTRNELRAQAAVLGLSQSGTKAQIGARIDAHLASVADRAKSVTSADYSVGTWAGHENYLCGMCQFASLSKRRIILHVAEVHG